MKQLKNKTHIIPVITLIICIITTNQSVPAIAGSRAASKKLNISHSTMKMKAGAKKKLTIKNAHKKVTWSSSNPKVAIIASETGKYKNKAVIRAKKAGSCSIIAKSGNVKRKCKLRVLGDGKDNTNPNSSTNPNTTAADATATDTIAGIQFESVSATKNSIAVTLKMYNNTKKLIYYGLACRIEKEISGKWTILETTEPQTVPSIACLVEPGTSHSETFRISKLKDPVTNGNYRITVTDMSKAEPPTLTTVINSAVFQITDRS